MRRWVIAISTSWWLLVSNVAEAAPDLWARARDPSLIERDRTVLFAENALDRADYARDGRGFLPNDHVARDLRAGIRAMLLANASRDGDDTRTRLLLARVCRDLGDDACVIQAMRDIEPVPPGHRESIRALFALAIALARTGRTEDEILAYERYLELQRDPGARASALSNLAEARMRTLDFVGAIRDYRETLALSGGTMTTVLTRWGLAMALDRSGDLSGAIHESMLADAEDRPAFSYLDDPQVFFVPAYDVHWQKALGEMARATKASAGTQQAILWDAAATIWDRYISLATAAKDDAWVSLAQSHMKLCLSRANRARAATPPPRR